MANRSAPLFAILEAIEELSPAQRRKLQRRLYASGLFVPETLLTDQNRLAAAPALGKSSLRRQSKLLHTEKPKGDAVLPPSQPTAKNAAPLPYRSPVSGTMVLGAPESRAQEADPQFMLPLPGQAPERPIGVIVEQGTYILRWPGEAPHRVRLNFKTQVTAQEALYDTLIHVIEVVEKRLRDMQADPQSARLDLRSEDTLFVRQARGEIPCADATLHARHLKLRDLLQQFGGWRLSQQ